MSELGFRMGGQGERTQNTRIPRRKAAPRRNWKQQGQQVPSQDQTSTDPRGADGLNSFGPTGDQLRNQQMNYQNPAQFNNTNNNSMAPPQPSQISSDAFKERLHQRRVRRQSALQQTQQGQDHQQVLQSVSVIDPNLIDPNLINPAQTPVPSGPVTRQRQPQAVPVQVLGEAPSQQQNTMFFDMSAAAGAVPVPVQNEFTNASMPTTSGGSKTQAALAPPEVDMAAFAKKVGDLEKRHQEILVAVQREEVQRRKLEVSLRALHQEITEIRRAGENPVAHQDDIRREMRDLQHSLNSAMTDTSNRMQEQIRVVIEQSDSSKTAITKAVDEMLHQYHDLLYWMYATVVTDLSVHEACNVNSKVIATAAAGTKVLLHHPMIEIENGVWMQCRTVDNMGNSSMGHVCILKRPDSYYITDFSIFG